MAAIKEVVVFKLGELAGTAAEGVNITRVKLDAKAIVGKLQLEDKGVSAATPVMLGMCVDKSGNIYLSDYDDHIIVKINESGKINRLAGSSGIASNNRALQNVEGGLARFNAPSGIACDNSGNIYVADRNNNQVRIIKGDGKVGVYAGNGAQQAGTVDASLNPLQSKFNNPIDVAVDNSGTVYVADIGSGSIRRIRGGNVSTICGGGIGDLQNVKACKIAGANGFFTNLTSICVDANGNIFASDSENHNIKKITPNGWVYLFSGSGVDGQTLGTETTATVPSRKAYTCSFSEPLCVRCDRVGNVYVLDYSGSLTPRLVKLDPNGVPSNIVEFNTAGTEAANGITSLAVSPSGNVYVALASA